VKQGAANVLNGAIGINTIGKMNGGGDYDGGLDSHNQKLMDILNKQIEQQKKKIAKMQEQMDEQASKIDSLHLDNKNLFDQN